MDDTSPRVTPLHELHVRLGGRMTAFAGYALPVQYAAGIRAEHVHTRSKAGLFDVSHMGQIRLSGPDAARELETLTPASLCELAPGALRYGQLTDSDGGILDDFIVARLQGHLLLVANAARKHHDFDLIRCGLPSTAVELLEERALLALQGPEAGTVLARLAPGVAGLKFMTAGEFDIAGAMCLVSRSGYTGEDGFEISVPADRAAGLAETLLDHDDVEPVGLGARDSLRLEAGLCLYGHDISTATTPVEAALEWSIGRRRRTERGFPGANRILSQLEEGAARRRVGLRLLGRAPAREHAEIVDTDGEPVGTVTSGCFAPSLNAPIAMGYVERRIAEPDTEVNILVRGIPRPARVCPLPFVAPRYRR